MTRRRYRLLIAAAQLALVAGLAAASLWNILGALTPLAPAGWWGLALALPGLLLWMATLAAPGLLARRRPLPAQAFRLVYTSPPGWADDTARAALRNLAQAVGGLGITWARDGDGFGCWVSVPAGADVLHRMAADIFPAGLFEPDVPPLPTTGVTLLGWKSAPPNPIDLCRLEGIHGVYIFWQSERRASVSVWGPQAATAARALASPADLLPGRGLALYRPSFHGDNPYPHFPPFPPSGRNPGLAAVSNFARSAPALRVSDPALRLGLDPDGQPVGFSLPNLDTLSPAWLVGEDSHAVSADLIRQALDHRLPVFLFDGDGAVVTHLTKIAMRPLAAGQLLLCDLDRPAQAKFRLNPLWLPDDIALWPPALAAWQQWLAELGITPAALGQTAIRHTRVAVALVALAAQQRGRPCDPVALRDALDSPDLPDALNLPDGLLDDDLRAWWLAEGRHAPAFDAHLRLSHLRERLTQRLTIPEYRVLWRAPYDDPADLAARRTALAWRVPDPTGFRRGYTNSQLMALVNLLRSRPPGQPPALVVLHALNPGFWGARLMAQPAVRLLVSGPTADWLPAAPGPRTRLCTRLNRAAADRLAPRMGVSPADLRRLPPGRLVVRRGSALATADRRLDDA